MQFYCGILVAFGGSLVAPGVFWWRLVAPGGSLWLWWGLVGPSGSQWLLVAPGVLVVPGGSWWFLVAPGTT